MNYIGNSHPSTEQLGKPDVNCYVSETSWLLDITVLVKTMFI